jgi:hypothetical protein
VNEPDFDREDNQHIASHAIAVVVVVTGLLGLVMCGPPRAAYGQDTSDADLSLAVAMVAFNEAPGYPADLVLVWQVTRSHGDTSAERLAWLRRHSDCVLTDRPMTAHEMVAGNCRWARHLTDSDDQPEGWPAHWRWSSWVVRWGQTRDHARRFVAGELPRRGWPCSQTPITWGSDDDALTAAARGLAIITCVDQRTGTATRNHGFVRAAR